MPVGEKDGGEAGDGGYYDGGEFPVPVEACVDEKGPGGPGGRGRSGRVAGGKDAAERVEEERQEQQ